jgi:hypothetical protein
VRSHVEETDAAVTQIPIVKLQKPILLGCGIILVMFVVLIGVVVVWLATGHEGGVKLSNEMEEYAAQYLKEHRILDESEQLVAYYDATISLNATEAAILTTKRVIYHKSGATDSINLADIRDIRHRKETLIGDIFETFSDSGKSMKIEIAPLNQGETFKTALMNSWKSTRKK